MAYSFLFLSVIAVSSLFLFPSIFSLDHRDGDNGCYYRKKIQASFSQTILNKDSVYGKAEAEQYISVQLRADVCNKQCKDQGDMLSGMRSHFEMRLAGTHVCNGKWDGRCKNPGLNVLQWFRTHHLYPVFQGVCLCILLYLDCFGNSLYILCFPKRIQLREWTVGREGI